MGEGLNYHGLAALMTRTYRGEDLTELGQTLIQRSAHPSAEGAPEATLDLAVLLHLKGFHDMAREVQMQGLRQRQIYRLPAARGPALRLLALMVPGELNANTPLEFLVEDSDIELQQLFIAADLPFPEEILEHDVAMVAVGECENVLKLLAALEPALVHWPRPVLNQPAQIARLSRDVISDDAQGLEGVVWPRTVRMGRVDLECLARQEVALEHWLGPAAAFPVIVRPLDSHAGKGLQRIDDPDQWSAYLSVQPEADFFVSPFIDYRSGDGRFRKYRIALIEGAAFASHMAISDHWMIHYLNGGMEGDAEKRQEEAAFMSNFETGFAHRQSKALERIYSFLGLDYVILDCAEMPDGRLLVFEADSSAVVHAMDSIDLFPYKRPAMDKIFKAFRQMLLRAKDQPPGLIRLSRVS
ncbi:MAG: RimK family alpha-L-glutamate ligase [Ferrovum sp.]|nr:RimK family alpha-L-glutamate ligase [Ferrovum sp.]